MNSLCYWYQFLHVFNYSQPVYQYIEFSPCVCSHKILNFFLYFLVKNVCLNHSSLFLVQCFSDELLSFPLNFPHWTKSVNTLPLSSQELYQFKVIPFIKMYSNTFSKLIKTKSSLFLIVNMFLTVLEVLYKFVVYIIV